MLIKAGSLCFQTPPPRPTTPMHRQSPIPLPLASTASPPLWLTRAATAAPAMQRRPARAVMVAPGLGGGGGSGGRSARARPGRRGRGQARRKPAWVVGIEVGPHEGEGVGGRGTRAKRGARGRRGAGGWKKNPSAREPPSPPELSHPPFVSEASLCAAFFSPAGAASGSPPPAGACPCHGGAPGV